MERLGLGASEGIAYGKAYLFVGHDLEVVERKVAQPEAELKKLGQALETSILELEKIRTITLESLGEEKAQIFDSHIMLLQDPEWIGQVQTQINEQKICAESAFVNVSQQFVAMFESMEDDYMKERAADIRDVSDRVLSHILGFKIHDLSLIDEEVVIVARDLTPSQTATMNKKKVLGFITDIGGKTSHSAIMARTLGIPAIVGTEHATQSINEGDKILIDGETGQYWINPDSKTLEKALLKQKELDQKRKELEVFRGLSSETIDHHKVELAGNIGTPNDVDSLIENDAEAVGLYRTEFVFMDRKTMPTEDEQFEAYSKVLSSLNGKFCIIRTLDIGGDKKLPYLHVPEEENPFLGYRAIRICLDDVELFKTQLRALLRASVHGHLGIMFPMISSYEEIAQAKVILKECQEELTHKSISFAKDIKIGIMIEIPSAAMMVDTYAELIDFISIGTNDLTQYTCAVDRMNGKIEKLYNPYNPGLLRLIHLAITKANEAGLKSAMCGSMSHMPLIVPFLVGCGLQEFSMSPSHILGSRKLIRSLNFKDCQNLVSKVLSCRTSEEVQSQLKSFQGL